MDQMAQVTIETDGKFYGDSFDMNSIESYFDHVAIHTMGDEEITLNRQAVEAIVENAPNRWID